tara:strand:- start:851 stop:3562 length:2712 start_codon:yes stop_codon:yes gene_type:complete
MPRQDVTIEGTKYIIRSDEKLTRDEAIDEALRQRLLNQIGIKPASTEPPLTDAITRRLGGIGEDLQAAGRGIIDLATPRTPQEAIRDPFKPLRSGKDVAQGALRAAGSPFEVGIGAPTEMLSRVAGASPETAETIGKTSEILVPLGSAARLRFQARAGRKKAARKQGKDGGVIDLTEEAIEQRGMGFGPANPPLGSTEITQRIIRIPFQKRLNDAVEEVFAAGKIARNKDLTITDQAAMLMADGKIANAEIDAILSRNGIDFIDLANRIYRPGMSDAGRILNLQSQLSKNVNKLTLRRIGALEAKGTPAALAELELLKDISSSFKSGAAGRFQYWWRRADNARRGLMVGQTATAVRNFISQGVRVSLEAIVNSFEAGYAKALGVKTERGVLDGFQVLSRLASRNKKLTETILKNQPTLYDKLLGGYNSDIINRIKRTGFTSGNAVAEKLATGAESGIAWINTLNRFQEFLIRRGVFVARLNQEMLRRTGKGILGLSEEALSKLPKEAIARAIDQSLKMTFASKMKFGSVGSRLVSLVNDIPGATFLIPFPRFLGNSIKFYFEFNPTGMLKLLSPAQRGAIAAGDMSVLAKAAVGTSMLAMAWQIRNSEFAGDKWFHIKDPKTGKLIDVRAFNPFASYLFVADLIKKSNEGTTHTITSNDVTMGLFSSNLRAGTGLFLMDRALGVMLGQGNPDKLTQKLKEFTGEVGGSFFVPLQTIRDVLSEFDAEDRIIRNPRTSPLTGPAKRIAPKLGKELPPVQLPTRRGPISRQSPALRQATGITVAFPRNFVERENDRLGISRREIQPKSGDASADELIAKWMGEYVEDLIIPIIKSDKVILENGKVYRDLSEREKRRKLNEYYNIVHGAAKSKLEILNPELFAKTELQALSRHEKGEIEEKLKIKLP